MGVSSFKLPLWNVQEKQSEPIDGSNHPANVHGRRSSAAEDVLRPSSQRQTTTWI